MDTLLTCAYIYSLRLLIYVSLVIPSFELMRFFVLDPLSVFIRLSRTAVVSLGLVLGLCLNLKASVTYCISILSSL